MGPPSGVLILDKPEGPTSHDMVARVKRLLNTKAGHAGTLDPFATGVLPILCGKATRLMRFYQGEDKAYLATLQLGIETTTYDREGEVTSSSPVPDLKQDAIRDVLAEFTGPVVQTPPMFSAIKVQGQRLYKLARRGEEVERPSRNVTIHSLDLVQSSSDTWTLEVKCTSGTYIRSLAHDIGRFLGCGATLQSLARLASGNFRLDQSIAPEAIAEEWPRVLMPMEALLPRFPRVDLEDASLERVSHGNPIPWEGPGDSFVRLFGGHRLVAIARPTGASLQPVIVF